MLIGLRTTGPWILTKVILFPNFLVLFFYEIVVSINTGIMSFLKHFTLFSFFGPGQVNGKTSSSGRIAVVSKKGMFRPPERRRVSGLTKKFSLQGKWSKQK